MTGSMTQATSKRRGRGEGSIYWDESKNRYIRGCEPGVQPLTRGANPEEGYWRTKTEVRDKLRDLHKQVEGGLRPRRRYTRH
jgi:hypothetical protein